jgi:hypothetical protein
VRYRYDVERKKRLKTAEILVAERDWEPPPPRFAPEHIVEVRVALAETAIRDRVKRAGGTWNPDRRLWQMRYDRAVRLGLTRRIVDDQASNTSVLSLRFDDKTEPHWRGFRRRSWSTRTVSGRRW